MTNFRIQQPNDSADLSYRVMQLLWEHFDFYDDRATFESSVAGATRGQMAIFACRWYDHEVCNGGHHQFFSNSTGMVWGEALQGFSELEAKKHEEILKAAIELFPEHRPSMDRQTRCQQLEFISANAFDAIDDQLYALNRECNLDQVFDRYIHDHPEEFFI